MVSEQDIISFYERKVGYKPHNYQIKVAKILLNSDKNIILKVPTGAGKTLAATMPFLISKEKQLDFPPKMVYSSPMRIITNSIYSSIKNIGTKCSIQTGEYREDKFFESELVFCTIDQALAGFSGYSLNERISNITSGAFIGSYLVFDEFHLFDYQRAMKTSLAMLKILSTTARFVIMTATLSNAAINILKDTLNVEIVDLDGDEFADDKTNIGSISPYEGKKTLTLCGHAGNDNSNILQKLKEENGLGNKTIVITNRVKDCINLAIQAQKSTIITNKVKKENIICIHSRFFGSDRKKIEKRIIELFSKDSDEPTLLFATQVIEAGIDITCDVMHSHIAPINSLLQRFGRCARYMNEKGNIFVYDIVTENQKTLPKDKLDKMYAPYNSTHCNETYKALSSNPDINGNRPTELVNLLYSSYEEKEFSNIISDLSNRMIDIKSTINDYRPSFTNIRKVENVDIIISDLSEISIEEIKTNAHKYETVSIHSGSFATIVKKSSLFSIYKIVYNKDEKIYDVQELSQIEKSNLYNQSGLYLVDKKIFRYNKYFGLNTKEGDEVSTKIENTRRFETIEYKKDTYQQHIMALYGCFKKEFENELNFLDKKIYNLSTKKLVELISIAIYFHDLGKLNPQWQGKIKNIQKQTNPSNYVEGEILAHSDFNFHNPSHREISKKYNTKGIGHAQIGAIIAAECMYQENSGYEDFEIEAVLKAICKHHSSKTSHTENIKPYQITTCTDMLNNLKTQIQFNIDNSILFDKLFVERPTNLNDFDFKGEKDVLLYSLVVRILRLCDQRATKNIDNYITI